MKKSRVLSLAGIFILIWVVGWSVVAVFWYQKWAVRTAKLPAAQIEAFQFRFGLLKNDGNNNYSIVRETTTIPMTFGDSSYGFQVIPPGEGTYTVQFVSHFPYPPKTISGDVYESSTPGKDMRSVSAEMSGGYIQDLGFDPGDPVGDQSIDILIDGKLARTIKFTVTEAK
jgi:hypothetical protein